MGDDGSCSERTTNTPPIVLEDKIRTLEHELRQKDEMIDDHRQTIQTLRSQLVRLQRVSLRADQTRRRMSSPGPFLVSDCGSLAGSELEAEIAQLKANQGPCHSDVSPDNTDARPLTSTTEEPDVPAAADLEVQRQRERIRDLEAELEQTSSVANQLRQASVAQSSSLAYLRGVLKHLQVAATGQTCTSALDDPAEIAMLAATVERSLAERVDAAAAMAAAAQQQACQAAAHSEASQSKLRAQVECEESRNRELQVLLDMQNAEVSSLGQRALKISARAAGQNASNSSVAGGLDDIATLISAVERGMQDVPVKSSTPLVTSPVPFVGESVGGSSALPTPVKEAALLKCQQQPPYAFGERSDQSTVTAPAAAGTEGPGSLQSRFVLLPATALTTVVNAASRSATPRSQASVSRAVTVATTTSTTPRAGSPARSHARPSSPGPRTVRIRSVSASRAAAAAGDVLSTGSVPILQQSGRQATTTSQQSALLVSAPGSYTAAPLMFATAAPAYTTTRSPSPPPVARAVAVASNGGSQLVPAATIRQVTPPRRVFVSEQAQASSTLAAIAAAAAVGSSRRAVSPGRGGGSNGSPFASPRTLAAAAASASNKGDVSNGRGFTFQRIASPRLNCRPVPDALKSKAAGHA
eukprot:TRINITY_DN19076_c0_g1_i1.p1 TRINITY_DN19076_c0_g1~~TRINITY_DN19076_c0_g1_i1.p1  ORF type:complete len:641 (-),score=124.51 TRINITY_DN19076_c0_g1_i1:208-2130(-)